MSVRVDPRLRADGNCANCRKPRKPRKHAVRNRYSGDAAMKDPFCSAGCARAWHGCALPSTHIERAQQRRHADEYDHDEAVS